MRAADILSLRLLNQRLEGRRFGGPSEAVKHFGAVQAQDFNGAAWAVCQRMERPGAAGFAEAFARGEVVRTHVMRPTWHFVAAEDIRWLTDLTRPRLLQSMAYYFRQMDLDERALAGANRIIQRALAGGNELTREELAAHLSRNRINGVSGVRLAHILVHAEASGLICSGAPRGKQQTYALLEERAPQAKALDRGVALAELARRYFVSHGPATLEDYTWWSGLAKGDAQAGLQAIEGGLHRVQIAERQYWYAAGARSPTELLEAHVLPNYDEYVVAYADRAVLFNPKHTSHLDSRKNPLFNNVLIVGGTIVGTWKKTVGRNRLTLDFAIFTRMTAAQRRAVRTASEEYAEYLGLSELSLTGV